MPKRMLILGASSSFPPFSSSSPCQLFCFSFLVSSIWNAVKWSELKWSEVKWRFPFIYDGIYKYPYRDFLYERLPSTSAPWSWLDLLIDPRELQRFSLSPTFSLSLHYLRQGISMSVAVALSLFWWDRSKHALGCDVVPLFQLSSVEVQFHYLNVRLPSAESQPPSPERQHWYQCRLTWRSGQ